MMSEAVAFYHSPAKTGHLTGSASYPIRDSFRQFYPKFLDRHFVSAAQAKAANCIIKCTTGELGYNASRCEECCSLDIHACVCNNRSYPNCQAPLEKKWIT